MTFHARNESRLPWRKSWLPGACPSLAEALASDIDAWLTEHGETLTFEDLAMGRLSALEEETILPAAMVGRIVSVDGYGIELPESLRFRLAVRAQAGTETLLETTLDVAALSAGEAVLWYEPAGPEDLDVVEALGGYLWDVPPYLVNVAPVVMVGQEIVAQAEDPLRPGIGMGQGYSLELTMTTPSGLSWTWTNGGIAGVPVGLGVSAGRQGYSTPYEEPASTIQLLSKLRSDYLDAVTQGEEQLAALDQLSVVHLMPSVVAVSAVIEPVGTLGMVTDLETGEGKYQLAGGLSGGMTVLPPELIFEVIPEMWPPTDEPAVDDPFAAAILKLPVGLNGQIGRVEDLHSPRRDGFRRELDISYLILKALSIPHIVWGVREPPKRVLSSNRLDGRDIAEAKGPLPPRNTGYGVTLDHSLVSLDSKPSTKMIVQTLTGEVSHGL